MAFVVDASMAMAWHFLDEVTPGRDELLERTLDEELVVPPHWFIEVANGALVGERRRRATVSQSQAYLNRIAQMRIEMDAQGAEGVFTAILPLARAHKLTVYDTLYLELAERRGLPLATLDVALADAARSIGVQVLDGEGR